MLLLTRGNFARSLRVASMVFLAAASTVEAQRQWVDLGANTDTAGNTFDTANGSHFASDGKELLLLESNNGRGLSRFDPSSSRFAPLADIPIEVFDGGDLQFANGLYLATVGNILEPGGGRGPLLYAYDPGTDEWSKLASAMIGGVLVAIEALAYDDTGGLAYATVVDVDSGGQASWQQGLAIYDPATDEWLGATAPSGVLFEEGTEAEYLEGRVFVWPGGRRGTTVEDSRLLVYNIASNSWSVTRSLAEPRFDSGWLTEAFDVWGVSMTADPALNAIYLMGGEGHRELYVFWRPLNIWFQGPAAPYDGGWGSSLEYVEASEALYVIDGRNEGGETQGSAVFAEVASSSPVDRELAFHHAPVHYQDTDSSDPVADYITRVNFDGDWVGDNNWDNLFEPVSDRTAFMYYSVVETCSHRFVVYSAFHPRDWTDSVIDQEHENDLEGYLAVIEKDGSEFGTLQGIITVFHREFHSYTPAESPLTDGHEEISGELFYEQHEGIDRPRTAQEAKGHGLKAWPEIEDFDGSEDQDGVIYFPVVSDSQATEPADGNDRSASYALIDLLDSGGLWSRQLSELGLPREDVQTFAAWGTFKGDESGGCGNGFPTCAEDSANAPWGWDHTGDGDSYRGEMGFDPANLADHYFDGVTFSQVYERNRFLEELQEEGYSSQSPPPGWPDEIDLDSLYAKLGSCQADD